MPKKQCMKGLHMVAEEGEAQMGDFSEYIGANHDKDYIGLQG